MRIKIRQAKKSDSKGIIRLITELAKFEKLTPPDFISQKRLIKDAFSKYPLFKILVADNGKELIGYAFYLFSYSTFLAKKTLYLEDIYITNRYRNKGVGKIFWGKLLEIANKNNCGRIEFIVLNWNKKAIKFYKKLGAKELKEWKFFRLTL